MVAADRLSPFKFYQYLLTNVGDAEIMKFLRMLTFVPLEELETLEASMHEPGYRPNTAQRLLAAEVTRFVHGQQGLDQALKATEVHAPIPSTLLQPPRLLLSGRTCIYHEVCMCILHICEGCCSLHCQASLYRAARLCGTDTLTPCHKASAVCKVHEKVSGTDMGCCAWQALAPGSDTALDAETLEAVAESAPSVELHREQVVGQPLTDVMVAIKLQDSKAAARRLIKVGSCTSRANLACAGRGMWARHTANLAGQIKEMRS